MVFGGSAGAACVGAAGEGAAVMEEALGIKARWIGSVTMGTLGLVSLFSLVFGRLRPEDTASLR